MAGCYHLLEGIFHPLFLQTKCEVGGLIKREKRRAASTIGSVRISQQEITQMKEHTPQHCTALHCTALHLFKLSSEETTIFIPEEVQVSLSQAGNGRRASKYVKQVNVVETIGVDVVRMLNKQGRLIRFCGREIG